MCVCIPILVMTFPEWLSGMEPLPHTPTPGAVHPSSLLLYPWHLCRGVYSFYTPGIYAAGYIVFALTFVRSYVRSFVRVFVRSFVTFRHVRRIYLKVFG